MMDRKIDGLTEVEARRGGSVIATDAPTHEIAATVAAGSIVIVKGAFDPAELRRVRAAILAWQTPGFEENRLNAGKSSRHRSLDPPGTQIRHVFDSYLFAVNEPDDGIGPVVRPVFERLAVYWRSLTGSAYDFVPGADGRAIRPRALHYPAGGGYFDWHEHPLEPHRIGLILGMSEIGVDFRAGATEFRTPFGVVSTLTTHNIGDLCLFRYDLSHRVTPVDPDRERRWDGAGRWTFIIPVQ
jgi:hypothetical protein